MTRTRPDAFLVKTSGFAVVIIISFGGFDVTIKKRETDQIYYV